MMELLTNRTLDNMTPKEIVASLDKYVIGQNDAKRTIAVALRNRVRRKRLPKEIRDEVTPKNIRIRKTILDGSQRMKVMMNARNGEN